MKRFYEANASETPPKPPLNPSYGYPQNGNRSLNQKPTKLGAYWFHMITEEFMAVIEGAGLEPDENNLHQLADIFQDFRDRATASEEFKVAAEAAAKRSEEAAKGVVTETASKIKEIQAEGKKQVDAVAQQGTAIQGQVDSAIDSIMAKATEVNAEVQAVGGQEQSALRTACQQQIEEIKRLFPTYVSDLNQSMVKTDAQSLSTKQKQQVMNNLGGTWLPLSGGTMTGSIQTENGELIVLKNANFSIGDTSRDADFYARPFVVADKDGKRSCAVEHVIAASGGRRLDIQMRNREDTGWIFAGITEEPNGRYYFQCNKSEALLPVGAVFAFASNTAPAGCLLCNGAAVSRTTYKYLFEAIGTTYGEGDGSTTFNLPNLTDKFIQGSGTAGTVKSAGVPNVTGTLSVTFGAQDQFDGAFKVDQNNTWSPSGSSSNGRKVSFDASRCSSIYGASTTVQPPALTMRYYIKF